MDTEKTFLQSMLDEIQEELEGDDPHVMKTFARILATYYTLCIGGAESLDDGIAAFKSILMEMKGIINSALQLELDDDDDESQDFVGRLR